ncbi:MAG: M23 family metallopeptidase [Erythrobacter sp.]
MFKDASAGAWGRRLRDWFPDREFFMRSQGQVRFIKVSSRVQMGGAAAVLALLVVWGVSMGVMGFLQYRAEADRLALVDEKARVASASERVDAYSEDIGEISSDLAERMRFLEKTTEGLPADMKSEAEMNSTVTDSSSETAKTIDKVSKSFPEAAELVRIEARQIAYVERLTLVADERAKKAANAIRQLGLDPSKMLKNASKQAMGGPLELLATSSNGDIDPRFERLGVSLERMEALERGLASIPQVTPTSLSQTKVSSAYGYRRDPINGGGAMHSGLDFKGPYGAPIYSAAAGEVTFAGWKGGYGKTVEVTHGNGMMTRYAHMSRFHSREGQEVAAGDIIGAIGSTGRSTGPHLHFEVRINNRAVNPRPFLDRSPDVLKENRRARSSSTAKSAK